MYVHTHTQQADIHTIYTFKKRFVCLLHLQCTRVCKCMEVMMFRCWIREEDSGPHVPAFFLSGVYSCHVEISQLYTAQLKDPAGGKKDHLSCAHISYTAHEKQHLSLSLSLFSPSICSSSPITDG